MANQPTIQRRIKRRRSPPERAAYWVESSKPKTPSYQVDIDLDTGVAECNCLDYDCHRVPDARDAGTIPNIFDPRFICVHIELCLADLIRTEEVWIDLAEWGDTNT